MPNEEPTLLQALTEGVRAHDVWGPQLRSQDGGHRVEARRQMRGIEERMHDVMRMSPIEVARLLVELDRRLSTVERELDPEHAGLASRVQYLSERMSGE